MTNEANPSGDAEFEAMRAVYAALKGLDKDGQNRVLVYVCQRLSLVRPSETQSPARTPPDRDREPAPEVSSDVSQQGNDDADGISPVAQKWIRRNGLKSAQLSALFSLGGDEIDLVATSIPGKSRADRVRSVMLLKGIAAYLSSGAARVSDDKLREACAHYDAYDVTNFTKQLKAIAAEATGTRESGYTLTARGIAQATELIRQMLAAK